MSLESKDVLIENLGDFFSQNRENFLDFCIKLIKGKNVYVSFDELKTHMGSVYDSVLAKEPYFDQLNQNLDRTFDYNIELKNYIISRSFLCLIRLHVERENRDYTLELIKAIEDILKILCNEKDRKPKEIVNFATSILEADDEFSVHENIVDTFSKIRADDVELEFLNLYKDVPVKGFGKVVSTEENYVVFEVGLMQMLAIIEEKNAFIVKNDYTKKHIKADIMEYDIINRTIKLGNFSRFKSMPASQRVYTRVHPIDTTQVILSKNNKQIKGLLYDISEGGMAVLSGEELGCESGDNLRATFELTMPHSTQKVQIEQELQLVIQIDYKGAHRYCMKSITNEVTQNFITNFTKQREIDTIEDLKQKIDTYKD